MKTILALLAFVGLAAAQIPTVVLPHVFAADSVQKQRYIYENDTILANRIIEIRDSVNQDTIKTRIQSLSNLRLTIDADANATGACLSFTHNGSADTLAKVCDDSVLTVFKDLVINRKLILTDSARLTQLTASRPVETDAAKHLVSGTVSGTGAFVKQTSPTLVTPALGVATATSLATSGIVSVLGTTDAASTLQVGGSESYKVAALTSNTTLDATHNVIEAAATGGSFTLTLPAASGCTGRRYTIHKNDASSNTVTVDGNASETIDGALTVVLGGNVGNSHLVIRSNGTGWRIEWLYEEGTFNFTAVGFGSSPSIAANYARTGRAVTLSFNQLFATSNSTSTSLTGMPSSISPATLTQEFQLADCYDNTTTLANVNGKISSGGTTITLMKDGSVSGWTASGTKGCTNSQTFAYQLK